MRLFFDTETTGLPFNNYGPEHPEYPHIIQLCAILVDDKWNQVNTLYTHIRIPEHSVINPGAFNAHGITKEYANKHGIPCEIALMLFNEMVLLSDEQIAHNFKFDYLMIKKALKCYFEDKLIKFPNPTCTMELTTNICKLPGKGNNKYKWPKLEEAYEYYYKEKIENAHNSMSDTQACLKIYKAYLESAKVSQPVLAQ